MFIKQFYLNCLAQASYLVGDEESATAAVIDPRRDIAPYLEEADRRGVRIRHVFLTHFHADFIAGHLELRERTGATIHLGAAAHAEYPFAPMKDGDAVDLGRVRLVVLGTPGHTAESISILIYDLNDTSGRPKAVLTGDTLFVGDVGRPDLRASLGWSAAALGRLLYDSLHTKLLTLPDDTLVYPAHGAGSLCGKSLSTETVSTIGAQRLSNYALQPMSPEEFIALVTADQPDPPPYFTYDAVLNAKEHPTLDTVLKQALRPLSLEEMLELRDAGGDVVDVRDPADFANVHIAGSLNIGLAGQYATWAGTVLSRERPIAIIADPGREEEAAMRLGRIGFDHVAGYLQGGLQTLDGYSDIFAGTNRLSPVEVAELLASSEPPFVLDVRTPREWAEMRIDSSVNVPLNHLIERLNELPRTRSIVVHCAGGYRSSIAVSLLQRSGFHHVFELAGGIAAWQAARCPCVLAP